VSNALLICIGGVEIAVRRCAVRGTGLLVNLVGGMLSLRFAPSHSPFPIASLSVPSSSESVRNSGRFDIYAVTECREGGSSDVWNLGGRLSSYKSSEYFNSENDEDSWRQEEPCFLIMFIFELVNRYVGAINPFVVLKNIVNTNILVKLVIRKR